MCASTTRVRARIVLRAKLIDLLAHRAGRQHQQDPKPVRPLPVEPISHSRVWGHGVIALRWSPSGLWQLRRVTMTSYAGLDVSQQETQICVVDATGAVRWCGKGPQRAGGAGGGAAAARARPRAGGAGERRLVRLAVRRAVHANLPVQPACPALWQAQSATIRARAEVGGSRSSRGQRLSWSVKLGWLSAMGFCS